MANKELQANYAIVTIRKDFEADYAILDAIRVVLQAGYSIVSKLGIFAHPDWWIPLWDDVDEGEVNAKLGPPTGVDFSWFMDPGSNVMTGRGLDKGVIVCFRHTNDFRFCDCPPCGPFAWANPSYYMYTWGGVLERRPVSFYYWGIYIVPALVDFGYAIMGDQEQSYLINRYDESVSWTAATQGTIFNMQIPALPYTLAPSEEFALIPTVVLPEGVEVSETMDAGVTPPAPFSPVTKTLTCTAVFSVFLHWLLYNIPSTRLKIKYAAQTKRRLLADGTTKRFLHTARPVRQISYTVCDAVEGRQDFNTFIDTAVKAVIVPIWPLYANPTTDPSYALEIDVDDITEFEVENLVAVWERRLRRWEVRRIFSILGNKITLARRLDKSYVQSDTWIIPAISTFATVKQLPTLVGTVDVLEIDCLENVVTSFTQPASEVDISNIIATGPRTGGGLMSTVRRKGKEYGISSQVTYRLRPPVISELEFQLIDVNSWRNIRNAFFTSVHGGTVKFCTWRGELRVHSNALIGSTFLDVTPTWYKDVWSTYPTLIIQHDRRTQQVVTVTNVSDFTTYLRLQLSAGLTKAVTSSLQIHFKVSGYFVEDTLELDFKLSPVCNIIARLIEN